MSDSEYEDLDISWIREHEKEISVDKNYLREHISEINVCFIYVNFNNFFSLINTILYYMYIFFSIKLFFISKITFTCLIAICFYF